MCAIHWSDSTRPSSELTVLFPAPNGLRYPLVGGTRQHHFDGTNFKPRKMPENAQTPTSRVHAVLGGDERNEQDCDEHDSIKHLRRMGLQPRQEGSMRRKGGRANKDELRHEAHAVLKITWFAFAIHVARGVRADWSDSTRPSNRTHGILLAAQLVV